MWLLRTLPNNVLGHIGIKYGLKGTNACITNHSVGGLARRHRGGCEALRNGEADRVVAVGHETPIEPQMVLYYHGVGLLASRDAAAVRCARATAACSAKARARWCSKPKPRRASAARACSAKCWAAATPAKPRACSPIRDDGDGAGARDRRRRSTTRASRRATSA